MKKVFIKIITFYQKNISPIKGPSCVFFPTCSEYTRQAIEKYGILKGVLMGLHRIFRCHPWQTNHFDPLK